MTTHPVDNMNNMHDAPTRTVVHDFTQGPQASVHDRLSSPRKNLVKLKQTFGAYGEGGFYDAVAVKSGTVAQRYLSLDQAMIMGSIGNVFGGNVIRNAFATGEIQRRIRPLIGMEKFGAGRA